MWIVAGRTAAKAGVHAKIPKTDFDLRWHGEEEREGAIYICLDQGRGRFALISGSFGGLQSLLQFLDNIHLPTQPRLLRFFGWWQLKYLLFSPRNLGKIPSHFWRSDFSKGLVQPPTSSTLGPQNHAKWRFYTPNIWVITSKNEGFGFWW